MIEQIIYKHKFENFLENYDLDYFLETCEVESVENLTIEIVAPTLKSFFDRSVSIVDMYSFKQILFDFSNVADWREISKLVINQLNGVTK
jgi:hypothetical protein